MRLLPVRSLTVVLNVSTHSLDHMIWQYICECTESTLEKSQQMKSLTVVLSVITLALGQNTLRCIWESTLGKSLIAALSVITLVPNQQIWRDMWWEIILERILSTVLNDIIWLWDYTKLILICTHCDYHSNRTLGAFRAPTSSWRPSGCLTSSLAPFGAQTVWPMQWPADSVLVCG